MQARLAKILAFVIGFGAGPAAAASLSLGERLEILKQSYPHAIAAIGGNKLLLSNGTSLPIDDGATKTHRQKLISSDIEDMLSQIYPLGSCAKGLQRRDFDPGRLRNDAFFREIYGRSEAAAAKNQTSLDWFGRPLRFTTINGADQGLIRVRDDLAKLGADFRKYFQNPAGTFNWRPVAGTKRLSIHSFGAAIDIDTKYADYWRWAGGRPGNVPRYRNKIPMAIVEVFERHGFIWGGRWYHFDTMHFEFRPELIALGRLALARGCSP